MKPESSPQTWRLVTARRIHTFAGPPVEALVTFGERVVATGRADRLAADFPVGEPVRLDGVVVPGFNDAHAHLTTTAENLLHADCSPEAVRSEQALGEALRRAAAGKAPGEWVIGSRYDESKTTAGAILDRHALDAFVPDHPALLVHVASHWGILNSAGLQAAGLDDRTEDLPGGRLGRDEAGRLNGLVYERHLFEISTPSLARGQALVGASSLDARLAGLARAQEAFHAAGITSMCDALCGPDDVALLGEAARRGELTLRTGMLVAYPHFDALRATGLTPGFGDDHLRLVGVKAFVDGACAGGNCLVDEPFEGTCDHGMQVIPDDELDELVARVTSAGWTLGVHANGDRAIRKLLDAHERARAAGAAPGRHRIEHCSLVDEQILARMKALALVAVPFGAYARFHGDKLVHYYGKERLERMFAHRGFIDAGVAVAGSSDYPCGPYEPLAALASCVQRTSLDGAPIGLSQRISVEEALRLYTVGSAYATGEEDRKGTLAPGMLADFVELAEDPFAIPVNELASLPVLSTWVGATRVTPIA